jgi:hypothetical protein
MVWMEFALRLAIGAGFGHEQHRHRVLIAVWCQIWDMLALIDRLSPYTHDQAQCSLTRKPIAIVKAHALQNTKLGRSRIRKSIESNVRLMCSKYITLITSSASASRD